MLASPPPKHYLALTLSVIWERWNFKTLRIVMPVWDKYFFNIARAGNLGFLEELAIDYASDGGHPDFAAEHVTVAFPNLKYLRVNGNSYDRPLVAARLWDCPVLDVLIVYSSPMCIETELTVALLPLGLRLTRLALHGPYPRNTDLDLGRFCPCLQIYECHVGATAPSITQHPILTKIVFHGPRFMLYDGFDGDGWYEFVSQHRKITEGGPWPCLSEITYSFWPTLPLGHVPPEWLGLWVATVYPTLTHQKIRSVGWDGLDLVDETLFIS